MAARILPWVGLWSISVLVIVVLARSGYALEDLQTCFFPLILFAYWRLSKAFGIALPRGLVFFALAFWLAGTLHVRGYYPADFYREGVYLGRLKSDSAGTSARALYQRYNQIAEHYQLSPMYLIHRNLGNPAQMSEWMADHPKVSMLLGGTTEWLTAALTPRSFFASSHEGESTIAAVRSAFQLPRGVGLQLIGVADIPSPLVLVTNPPAIQVPSEPTELTRHYLAWLARGLATDATVMEPGLPSALESLRAPAHQLEILREARLYSLGNASFVDGPWRTYAPRGLASFYQANLLFAEALSSASPNTALLDAIEEKYSNAMGGVLEKYEPELWAAIANNAAVAYLILGSEESHVQKANKLLSIAMGSSSRGVPATIAGVAVSNLARANDMGMLAIER